MKIKTRKLRKRLLVYLAHEVALPYLKYTRKDYKFPYSLQQLQCFREGTVGHELYLFFTTNNINLLPYYEKHDIKHVVLGYPPTEEGEISLQCFMLANGRITLPVLFSVLIGFTIMPDRWTEFARAWKKGRQTLSLNKLNWFRLIPLPLKQVRQQIFSS